MPTIPTLSGRSHFTYTGDCNAGFYLEYTGRPFVPANLIEQICRSFQGQTIPGGFNVTNPTGFGGWLMENTDFSSKHGSHIAAVLVHENRASFHQEGNAIFLTFPRGQNR